MALFHYLLIVTAFVYVHGGGHSITGGGTGDNNVDFIDGTPNTAKLNVGAQCIHNENGDNKYYAYFYATQNDPGFVHTAPSILAAAAGDPNRVIYKTCFMADYNTYATTNRIINATGCTTSREFERIVPLASDVEYASYTLWKKVEIDFNDLANVGCGGKNDDGPTNIYFTFVCKQDYGFDQHMDAVYTVAVKNTAGKCFVSRIESDDVDVTNIPEWVRETRYELTLDFFQLATGLVDTGTGRYVAADRAPSSLDKGIPPVGAAVELGSTVYLEACLRKKDTDDRIHRYFEAGTPMGVRLGNCYAIPSAVGTTTFGTKKQIIDSDGCGTRTLPMQQFDDEFAFQYVEDEDNGKLEHRRSPNCFRTRAFPLVSFQRYNPGEVIEMAVECEVVQFCTEDDQECFDDYLTTCGDSRKKRDVGNSTIEIPSTVSTVIMIQMPGEASANKTVQVQEQLQCFEKNAFIGLSSALGGLLLIVLVVASCIALRLWSAVDDDVSRSTDSMTGIKNKAYY